MDFSVVFFLDKISSAYYGIKLWHNTAARLLRAVLKQTWSARNIHTVTATRIDEGWLGREIGKMTGDQNPFC